MTRSLVFPRFTEGFLAPQRHGSSEVADDQIALASSHNRRELPLDPGKEDFLQTLAVEAVDRLVEES